MISLAVLLLLACAVLPLHAITRQYTGTFDDNWNDPDNWNPAGLPQNGDDLVFGGTSRGMTNDLTNLTVRSLAFESGSWELNGNELGVQTSIDNKGDGLVEIRCPLRLEGAATFSAFSTSPPDTSDLRITGEINLNGRLLNLLARNDATVDLAGPISGSGSIRIRVETINYFNGSGDVRFSGNQANTFNGSVILDSEAGPLVWYGANLILDKQSGPAIPGALFVGTNGTVKLNRSHQIADDAAVGLEAGAHLLLQGNTESIGSLTMFGSYSGRGGSFLNLGAPVADTGGATLSVAGYISASSLYSNGVPEIKGKLGLPPGNHTIQTTGNQPYDLEIEAQIIGDGGFTKTGTKGLILNASNSFNGDVFVQDGGVVVGHASALGSVNGTTTLAGGFLDLPGLAISGETLIANSSPGSDGAVLAGSLASWAGPVILNTNLYVFGLGMTFAGPISGAGGITFGLSGTNQLAGTTANTYTGVTTVLCPLLELNKSSGLAAFSGPLVVGGGPLYPVALVRWLQNYQAMGANVTLFENGSVDLNDHNDDFGAITFDSTALIMTGTGELGVYGLVTVNGSSFAPSYILGRLGLPTGYREFQINDLGYGLNIGADIVGPGHLRKTGPGFLGLGGVNSFTGLTVVDNGVLYISRPEGLGSPSTGTTVNDGATLSLPASGLSASVPETISLRGTGYLGGGALYVSGSITMRTPFPSIYPCLDLTTNATINTAANLIVDGFISGAGSLTKAGAGTLVFSNANANTFSGDTIVSQGTLELRKPNNTISVPGNLVIGPASGSPATTRWFQSATMNATANTTVNANSLLDLNGFDQTISGLTLNDGGDAQTGAGRLNIAPGGVVQVGSLSPSGSHASSSINGNLGLPGNNFITFNVAPYAIFPPFPTGAELEVSAVISVNGFEAGNLEPAGFSKVSLGRMRLSANNTYKGEAFVSGGTLQVDGSQPQSSARVDNGGRLQGSGTIGPVYFLGSSGVIAPGASAGILTTSNFNLGTPGDGVLQVELNGTTAGTGYDQVNVQGTVTLTGTTLSGWLNFSSAIGDQFTVIDNDLADPVIGTFNGLPQNANFYIGGELFIISYTGGTGNDVVLSRIATPPKPVLTIEAISPSLVRLLWPANDPAYRLEFSTNLPATNWTPAFPLPVIVGTNYVVTNATTGFASSSLVTPVAWYRLGENDPGAASGVALTNKTMDSAGANHLTQFGSPLYTSAVSSDATAQVASSLGVQLNGSGQYLGSAVLMTAINNFGIEAWVKPNAVSSAYQFVAYNGHTANNGWGIVWQDGLFQGWFGGVILFGSGAVTPGTWAHIAIVRDNGSSTLYINGVPAGSPTGFSPNPPNIGFGLGVTPQTAGPDFFNGALDEVRVFTFAPGQFSTNDLLLNRAATVKAVPPAKFYRLSKP